jgi:hypothetical protein
MDSQATEDGEEGDLPERERAENVVVDLREALDHGHLPWVIQYKRIDLPKQRTFYEFHESVNRDKQRDLIAQLVQAEAPIHVDYAIRRIAQAWDLMRVGPRIRKAGLQAIKMAERGALAERRGDFIWRLGQELDVVRSPKWDDPRTYRAIREFPPEEIDLVLQKLTEAGGGGTSSDELMAQAARVLGFDRVGETIRKVISARLKKLMATQEAGRQ